MVQEIIDPRQLLVKIAAILEQLKIQYLVTGGMAVFVWGRPRFTADIDIVIELQWDDISKLEKALRELGEAGYIDTAMMKEARACGGEFNFIDGETGVKVDFWVAKDTPMHRTQTTRRVHKTVLGETVYFISPEDLILNKLQWYAQSQSSRHLEDVESIFKISGEQLDKKYLKEWAEKLEVSAILNQFMKIGEQL